MSTNLCCRRWWSGPAAAAIRAAASIPKMLAVGLLGGMLSGLSAQAADCGGQLDARHRHAIDTPRHQLVFVPRPMPLAVGRHFGLDIVVCARAGASLPLALRVDADLPAQRLGLQQLPTVQALGAGRYRIEGLVLPTPGRWWLRFHLSADGRLDHLSHAINLE